MHVRLWHNIRQRCITSYRITWHHTLSHLSFIHLLFFTSLFSSLFFFLSSSLLLSLLSSLFFSSFLFFSFSFSPGETDGEHRTAEQSTVPRSADIPSHGGRWQPTSSHLILSCFILSCFILSYLLVSHLILSYLILFYLISSYLVLSYLVLSGYSSFLFLLQHLSSRNRVGKLSCLIL